MIGGPGREERRLGLGVGLDLPWRGPYGIVGDRVAERTTRFLQRNAHRFGALFVSWQPRDRGVPDPDALVRPLDALFDAVPIPIRTLHQTSLNLAGAGYDRGPVVALTNRLIARYGFAWVNEDLGSWSVRGRPLPYPQPPPLTEEGVDHCTRACAEVAAALDAPLVVEFPGFEVPAPWRHGELDAYDAFRRVVEGAGVRCTLDTGHLLTWRWLQGHRGDALLEDLDRLPLDRCVELHCAGARVQPEGVVDAHHGVLDPLQLELASRLMARCPGLRVVTFEDPRFDDDGAMPPPIAASLDALEVRTRAWMSAGVPAPASTPSASPARSPAAGRSSGPVRWEDELIRAFEAPTPFGRRCRAPILVRPTRGVGRIAELYREAISGWCAAWAGPSSDAHDALVLAFLASEPGREWSDFAWAVPGRCLEDAFGRFLVPFGREHLAACARVLALHPDPPFAVPEPFVRTRRGFRAVAGDPPVLYAAVDGQRLVGEITPLTAALLTGSRPAGAAPVVRQLASMGLLDAER